MKKYILLLGIVVASLMFASNTTKNDQAGEKVIICHIPPGNPENAHTIEISVNAWPAHEAHGCSLGPCDSNDGDSIDNNNIIHQDEEDTKTPTFTF